MSSAFNYASSISYPSPIIAGLAVSKLGTSSVTYSVGLFEAEDTSTTHVGRGRLVEFGTEGLISSSLNSLTGEADDDEDVVEDGESGDTQNKPREELLATGLRLTTGKPATWGHFVHVFTTSDGTQKSTPIPAAVRKALERLLV